MNRPLMSISPAAMQALEAYDWPGNVREMENVIERSVALTDGEIIERSDLPASIGGIDDESIPGLLCPRVTEDGVDMVRIIEAVERRMIGEALELSDGVKARAANLLGINRTTLVEKIKRHALEQ
jgi:DNA-binding NtrC family response regulator